MAFQRIGGIGFCILITSAIAYGQVAPQRRVHTHTDSGGRTVVVETVEGPDIDGRLTSVEEVVTETTQGRDTTHTRQDVFRVGVNAQRRLAETSEARQDRRANGDTSTVQRRWIPDANGYLRLTSQLVEETRSSSPDVQQIDTILLVPGINEPLREARRMSEATRRISPDVTRQERTESVRDVNGRWKPVEVRRGEVRRTATSERVEEETVERPDLSGNLAVTETNVIRRSSTREQEHVVLETYSPRPDLRGMNGRPPLIERVERTTTPTADGGRYTVEEVEARSRVSPTEPMRVVRRIVTTVSPTSGGESVTQRQVFELDANGRLRLVRIE